MLIKIILIVAVFFIILFAFMYYENATLMISNYEICSKRLPEAFDGTKFILIADLHSNQFGKNNEQLLEKIHELAPDFILIAGDLFIGKEYNFDVAYDLLAELSKQYQIFYSYGNHEQKVEMLEFSLTSSHQQKKQRFRRKIDETRRIRTFAEYTKCVKNLGVTILNNEKVTITDHGECLKIIGGTIGLDYFKRFHRPKMSCAYLNQCFGDNDSQEYQILIAHNPLYFDCYAQWGADLVVSGHVHGGIVRIPFLGGVISPQMQIFPKYDAGLFKKVMQNKEAYLIVSRGLGIHTLKVRLFNRPELVSVTLHHKSNS